MADDVTHTSTSPAGPPDGTKQVTDEHVTRGHMPVVKLAIATDGSATLIPADGTDGLLVNLGANNDVTVTGTVAVSSVPTTTVQATNLDIRDLTSVSDSVAAAQSGVWNITDISGTVSLPTGAATAARQDTGNSSLSSIDGKVTACNTGAVVLAAGAATIGKLAANSAVDIGDVDVTSVVPGTGTTNLGKAEDAIHNTGDVGVMALAVSNEANTARAADGDYLPIATDTEGNVRMVGNRDHDAVDAGEPVKIGARAIAHGANPTAVAAADRTDLYANRAGIQFVIGGHPNVVTSRTTYSAAAQTDVAIGPGTIGTGTKIVVTQVQVTVSNPTTATPSVVIGFGATNTPTGTGVVLAHPGIPGGGGVSRGDGSGILGIGGDGEELRITSAAATGGVMDVVVSYYTIES